MMCLSSYCLRAVLPTGSLYEPIVTPARGLVQTDKWNLVRAPLVTPRVIHNNKYDFIHDTLVALYMAEEVAPCVNILALEA